jgi:hypothetical protein
MVSSPVTDLLNESNSTDSLNDTFEESVENAEDKTLEIYRFMEDGVKMVSVNEVCIPLTSLLEMVGVDEEKWQNYVFATFVLSVALVFTLHSAVCSLLN